MKKAQGEVWHSHLKTGPPMTPPGKQEREPAAEEADWNAGRGQQRHLSPHQGERAKARSQARRLRAGLMVSTLGALSLGSPRAARVLRGTAPPSRIRTKIASQPTQNPKNGTSRGARGRRRPRGVRTGPTTRPRERLKQTLYPTGGHLEAHYTRGGGKGQPCAASRKKT